MFQAHRVVPVSQSPIHHIDPAEEPWLPRFRCIVCGQRWMVHPQPTEACPGQ